MRRRKFLRIKSVLIADDKKYVLMNAPSDKVSDIVKILPGIKSPTIMPLATEGWTSIHTVLDQKHFWEIVGHLKEAGAEGILVLPIEKMIMLDSLARKKGRGESGNFSIICSVQISVPISTT